MTLQLTNRLVKREKIGNIRQLQAPQNVIDFSSNDYLGLARSKVLGNLIEEEFSKNRSLLNGFGSTGSRLLTGNSSYVQNLEAKIAAFHGFEAGLIFNCGYMANVGLLSTIASKDDCILFDTGVHASTHDGICLSRAAAFAFKHNDTVHLKNRLENCSSKGNRFICIESIYSTDGSKAPLKEICRLTKEYGAYLIVDEAHAVGVCGYQGRGLVAELNLCSFVYAQVITFGKAIGTQGAIILGGQTLKQSLINFATSYIYTTALPFYSLVAISCSYELMATMESERKQLQRLVQLYCNTLPNASETHIQAVSIKGNIAAKKYAQEILEAGFDIRPLLSPTVQRGKEILRICLHAYNSENELKSLLGLIDLHNKSLK